MVAACHEPPPDYGTVAVDRGDIEERVTASGTISARTKVNVGSQISGTVAAVCVDRNQRVQKGQLLAQLDARVLDAQWARAEATWRKAQAERDRVRLQQADAVRLLGRTEKLVGDHMAAAVDLEAVSPRRPCRRPMPTSPWRAPTVSYRVS
jgi:HlyD family secretion protein